MSTFVEFWAKFSANFHRWKSTKLNLRSVERCSKLLFKRIRARCKDSFLIEFAFQLACLYFRLTDWLRPLFYFIFFLSCAEKFFFCDNEIGQLLTATYYYNRRIIIFFRVAELIFQDLYIAWLGKWEEQNRKSIIHYHSKLKIKVFLMTGDKRRERRFFFFILMKNWVKTYVNKYLIKKKKVSDVLSWNWALRNIRNKEWHN